MLIAACSSQITSVRIVESNPRPDYIVQIGSGTESTNAIDGTQITSLATCLQLSQDVLWRPGDEAVALTEHLMNESVLLIDDSLTRRISERVVETSRFRYDAAGNLSGSNAGIITLCYDVASFRSGNHIAQFFTSTTTGEALSYNFEIVLR